MARRMEDAEASNSVTVIKLDIRHDTWRAGAKMHREAPCVIDEPRGILPVDRNLHFAHMGNLLYMGDMVEVAVGQDNGVDLVPERLDGHRENAGIHKDLRK